MPDTQSIFPAIANGSIDEIESLLAADPGLLHARNVAEGHAGQTPLQAAAISGNLELVRYLVDRGAGVYEAAQWGYPAIWHADRHPHIVAYFLGEAADKADGTYGVGIDINSAARFGWTAQVRRHLEIDDLAVHRRGVIGETPLHWAAHNGHLEIVLLLLESGARIEADEIGLYGGKPLHWAAEHAPEVVRVLIERGALVDSRNLKNGRTPLIHCVRQHNDCAECARLLIEAGADVSATDADGKTAFDHARAEGRTNIAEVLERAT